MTELVELLGPSNIHLSVYENDADPEAKAALEDMAKKITCTYRGTEPVTSSCADSALP